MNQTKSSKTRVIYIVLGLFLGTLGIHNFYAGHSTRGLIQLLITLFTGWLIFPLIGIFIWNIVDFISVTKDSDGLELS